MSDIQTVTDSDFETAVLKADKPVLVDFWATWCGPCRMIAPIVEQIHGELGDKIKVMKMDIDENPAVPMQLGDRKSTRLNSSHGYISYAVFCLEKNTHYPAPHPHLPQLLGPELFPAHILVYRHFVCHIHD